MTWVLFLVTVNISLCATMYRPSSIHWGGGGDAGQGHFPVVEASGI